MDAARFWTGIFGVNFAIGVATGIVMEFEVDDGPFREIEQVGKSGSLFKRNVDDSAGIFVVEMAVLGKVRAITGGFALKIHLADGAVLNECLKAVIDRRKGNAGHIELRPVVNFTRSRVIAVIQQDLIDLAALTRHP